MGDAMVTARMSADKKRDGNSILRELGTNSSAAINLLYDYVLEHKALPFEQEVLRPDITPERWQDARAWLSGLPRLNSENEFSGLSDEAIRMHRLADEGLI